VVNSGDDHAVNAWVIGKCVEIFELVKMRADGRTTPTAGHGLVITINETERSISLYLNEYDKVCILLIRIMWVDLI
jgi:hypothetical protein